MDAVEFMKEYNRMCDIERGCGICDYHNKLRNHIKFIGEFEYETCLMLTIENPEFSVKYVEQWSKEHPIKTRLQDFIEKYPNAKTFESGEPRICASTLGYCDKCIIGSNCSRDCNTCWNQPLEG